MKKAKKATEAIKAKKAKGYTLIEVLVAIFLAVNVFAGTMVAYTAAIRYLNTTRAKQIGSSNAQMALNLMGKELYNVSCVDSASCDDVNEIISVPSSGSSSSSDLAGKSQTSAGGSVRRFLFCYKNSSASASCRNQIYYCANHTGNSCFWPAGSCSLIGMCNSGWMTIARNIESFIVTRSTITDVQIQVTADEGTSGGGVIVSSRTYYSSVSISYRQE